MLKVLVSGGMGTGGVEAYSHSRAGRERWVDRGEVGRMQVVKVSTRDTARQIQYQKVRWIKKKLGKPKDDFVVPEEVNDYGDCRVFKKHPVVELEEGCTLLFLAGNQL